MGIDLDSLLDEWKAPETFEVLVGGGGITFTCRSFESYSDYKQHQRSARAQGKVLFDLCSSKSAQMKDWPYLPKTLEEAIMAKVIQGIVVEPQLTDRDACHLMSRPLLVEHLLEQFDRQMKDARVVLLSERIESEKKDSAPTQEPQPSKPCAETCGDEACQC